MHLPTGPRPHVFLCSPQPSGYGEQRESASVCFFACACASSSHPSSARLASDSPVDPFCCNAANTCSVFRFARLRPYTRPHKLAMIPPKSPTHSPSPLPPPLPPHHF